MTVLTSGITKLDSSKEITIFKDGKTSTTNNGLEIIEMFLLQYKSDNTKRAYRNALYDFFKFFYKDSGYLTFSMMVLSPVHAIAYNQYLGEQIDMGNIKTATSNLKIKAVKSFYDFLIYYTTDNEGLQIFKINPFKDIVQRTENDVEGSEPLDMYEIELMLNNPYANSEHLQERNSLLLELAIATGIRNNALLMLKEENFINDGKDIYVETSDKGGKVAKMSVKFYYDRLMEWYNKDKATRGKEDNGTIFNLHPHSANRIIREWAKEVEIQKKITFHSLRTTTAVLIYRQSGNMYKVQKALHHSRLETSNRYVDKSDTINRDAETVLIGDKVIKEFDNKVMNMSEDEMRVILLTLSNDVKLAIAKNI